MIKARRISPTFKVAFVLGLVITGPFPTATAAGPGTSPASKRVLLAQNSRESVSPMQFEAEFSKNHEAVARYYEDSAAEMRAKVQEQKQLLEQYEDKSYLYGKKAQDLQSHTGALIRKYEQAAEADAKKANTHRQIAGRIKENLAGESRLNTVDSSRR
jgi:hypothetical protein